MTGPIIAWGELLWDNLPSGQRLGGAPANFAYHATCLGAETLLASRVGGDVLGDEAIRSLSRKGVDTSEVQRDADRPTGTVEVAFEAEEPHYAITADVAWDRLTLTDSLSARSRRSCLFCFGTLAQRSASARAALSAAIATLPADARRLCDLNLRPGYTPEVIAAALEAATVVKLNAAEVEILAQLNGTRDVPGWLFDQRGVELVAITRGAAGSSLVTPSERSDQPAFPCDPSRGDPVGAGDAFTAALAVGLTRSLPLAVINAAAARYAAFVAGARGAMPEIPAELRDPFEAARA